MARADGSILIKTSVDVSKAEKDLEKLKGKISDTEAEIEELTSAKEEAESKSAFSAAELDAEKAKLEDMKKTLQEMRDIAKDTTVSVSSRQEAKAAIPGQQAEISDQQVRVRFLQAEYNKLAGDVDRYGRKIQSATKHLNQQQEQAGQLAKEINSVSKASVRMADAQARAEKNAKLFARRLSSVVRSALVFTLITQGLAKFREWMGKVIQTNDEARQSIARLKGALLTLAQPIVDALIPAIVFLADVLTRVVLRLAQFVSFLSGKTVKESANAAEALNKETQALEGVGNAAKKAQKSLAGFDEINQLAGDSGGSSSSSSIAPSFDFDFGENGDKAQGLADLLLAIGAAFATWEISSGILDWFSALGSGKFSKISKVAAGLDGIAVGFSLLGWHWDQLTSGNLDPNSLKSSLLAMLETAVLSVGGASVISGLAGVGIGFGLLIALPIAATVVKFTIEMSDAQGQAAIANFKRTLKGIFAGEDWGSIVADFVSGQGETKSFWEQFVDSLNPAGGVSINDIISRFKLFGSESYVAYVQGMSQASTASGKWEVFKSTLASDWDGIVNWFKGLGSRSSTEYASGFDSELVRSKGASSYSAFAGGLNAARFTTLAGDSVEAFGKGFKKDVPVAAASSTWDGIKKVFSNAGTYFKDTFSQAWTNVKSGFSSWGSWINSNVVSPVKNFFSGLWTSISNGASNGWNKVKTAWTSAGSWFNSSLIQPVKNFFSGMWDKLKSGALDAWQGVKNVFSTVTTFFKDKFSDAWAKVKGVFSSGGQVFSGITDGISSAFKTTVNKLITGINNIVSVPFTKINTALTSLRNTSIFGLRPFSRIGSISIPRIPLLAQGAVIPPNAPFMAVLGDQRHGTNIEAPLSTIQKAVALVMEDMTGGMMAGFEATVNKQQEILEAILGIEIGDTTIGEAVGRYNRKMAVARGG